MRRRKSSDEDPEKGAIVALPIGGDIFRAQVIAEACRAEGLNVQLLTTELGAHPSAVGPEQQLLVRSEDVDKVREILNRQELS
jgi:hypothetical protein